MPKSAKTLREPTMVSALTGARKKSRNAAGAITPGMTASSVLVFICCSVLVQLSEELVRRYTTAFSPIVEIAFSYHIYCFWLWN